VAAGHVATQVVALTKLRQAGVHELLWLLARQHLASADGAESACVQHWEASGPKHVPAHSP
jgi:hypothetical protein